jgi:hypothetical protein
MKRFSGENASISIVIENYFLFGAWAELGKKKIFSSVHSFFPR